MPAIVSRAIVALALAALVAGGVSGCATDTVAAPTRSATPSATSTTPTAEPTETAAPEPQSTPVGIDCNELISLDAMYKDINPNFGLSESFVPEKGSDAAEIVAADGLACSWVNQSSGESVVVAVANFTDDEKLTELKNHFVTSSRAVPTFGKPPVEGYFQVNGSVGEAQVFSGPYWVSTVSSIFYEPGDALPVVQAALAGLGQ
jgi:hypothetical protein